MNDFKGRKSTRLVLPGGRYVFAKLSTDISSPIAAHTVLSTIVIEKNLNLVILKCLCNNICMIQ